MNYKGSQAVSESEEEPEIQMDDAVHPYALKMYEATARDEEYHKRPVKFEVNYEKMRINYGRPKLVIKRDNLFKAQGHNSHLLVDSPCSIGGSLPASAEIEHKKTFTGDITLFRPVIFGNSARIQLETDHLIPNSAYHKSLSADGRYNQVHEDLECSVKYTVALPPRQETNTKVIFSDKIEQGHFTIESTISGKVLINVFDQETQESMKVIEGDVYQIVSYAQKRGASPWNHFRVDEAKKCVRFTTEGRFRLVARINSKLITTQHQLQSNECCDDCCCCSCVIL